MIAPQALPDSYLAWNREWHAPSGRRLPLSNTLGLKGRFRRNMFAMRYRGPFALQPNNSTRRFEYPWAYQEIMARGSNLRIVEIGGGLSGLQFVLARQGHDVINVDPGLSAPTLGWALEPAAHEQLCRAFRTPISLCPSTIEHANLPDRSADVVLCVSVLEHLSDSELGTIAQHIKRVLRPNGAAVLTIDLFLDTAPFCATPSNRYGRNIDVKALLDAASLRLVKGKPEELFGFPEFDRDLVLANLSNYMIGRYPCLTQCVVAEPA